MSAESITPEYVSISGAATYSGFSVHTLREYISAGYLPAYRMSDKPGARIRVRLSDIDNLMKPVIPAEVYGGAK
jgi:excisionase family DNA binding protein